MKPKSGYGEIQWEKLASGEGDRMMKDLRSLPHEEQIEGQGAYLACEKWRVWHSSFYIMDRGLYLIPYASTESNLKHDNNQLTISECPELFLNPGTRYT